MNEIGLYADLAREHSFGLVAGEAEDIKSLMLLLVDSSWSKNARRFYDLHLDFANYKDMVWEKLLNVKKKY